MDIFLLVVWAAVGGWFVGGWMTLRAWEKSIDRQYKKDLLKIEIKHAAERIARERADTP